MTEKQVAANRMNALKSTGPKSSIGKGVSSRNSVKHGLLAEAPILSGLESRKAWEGHRNSVLESIAPVGYVEKLLTIRLAVVSWKIWRVARYEAEVPAAAIAAAELDLARGAEYGCGRPPDPANAHAKAKTESLIVELLKNLADMTEGEKLDKDLAVATVWALWREMPNDIEDISIPGIPDDDADFNAFDHWTAALVRKAAEVYAAAARMTPEALLNKCILWFVRSARTLRRRSVPLWCKGSGGNYSWSVNTAVESYWSRMSWTRWLDTRAISSGHFSGSSTKSKDSKHPGPARLYHRPQPWMWI